MKGSRGCDRWVAAGIVVAVAAGMALAWLPGVVSQCVTVVAVSSSIGVLGRLSG